MLIFDVECFKNYFLVLCKDTDSGKIFEIETAEEFKKLAKDNIFVSFNGIRFDELLIRLWLNGANEKLLKNACNAIIQDNMRSSDFYNEFACDKVTKINHIDLIEICPGKGGLKLYGARWHCKTIAELPFSPDKELTDKEKQEVKLYCGNDLEVTHLLFNKLEKQIQLRRNMSNQFKLDLRSKSDAQIAETIISNKIGRIPASIESQPDFVYKMPAFIKFETTQLNKLKQKLSTELFEILQNTVKPPEILKEQLIIGKTKYTVGMGGLHSNEKSVNFKADKEYFLVDADVASYYPAIILNQGLYPERLGPKFLEVYKGLVDERLHAKKSGNKADADSLKIVINGSFGKLGSIYSKLYAPDLLIQVTITGQLALLMLIERIELAGIQVVSANTDGIVIKCRWSRSDLLNEIIAKWEKDTQFEMEKSEYSELYSRDVNNYIAIKLDKSVKIKGCFKPGDWQKNPNMEICAEAIIEFLVNKIPIEETIRECNDITKFLTLRTVNGGTTDGNKIIRWYHAKKIYTELKYKTSGNKVPNSFGAKQCLTIPKLFPLDIDYQYYVTETKKMLNSIGIKSIGQMELF